MIGVEGQYIFRFSIGEFEDFISNDDLVYFNLIEEAGNVLPTFELTFTSANEKLLSTLNEGNILQVSFGRELDHLIDVELIISKNNSNRAGEDLREFNLFKTAEVEEDK